MAGLDLLQSDPLTSAEPVAGEAAKRSTKGEFGPQGWRSLEEGGMLVIELDQPRGFEGRLEIEIAGGDGKGAPLRYVFLGKAGDCYNWIDPRFSNLRVYGDPTGGRRAASPSPAARRSSRGQGADWQLGLISRPLRPKYGCPLEARPKAGPRTAALRASFPIRRRKRACRTEPGFNASTNPAAPRAN